MVRTRVAPVWSPIGVPRTRPADEVFVAEPPIAHPGVRFPPPLLFVAGFLIGWLIDRWLPHHIVPHAHEGSAQAVGLALLALALVILAWAFATFLRHRTAIYPNRPAARIVRDGPYRLTRNPMYVSLTLVYIGLALIINALLPLFLLPVVLVLLVRLVIQREERYLDAAFPEEYGAYRRDVRRWL